jgi:hypothetical protein
MTGVPPHSHKSDRILETDIIPDGTIYTSLPEQAEEGRVAILKDGADYELYRYIDGAWRHLNAVPAAPDDPSVTSITAGESIAANDIVCIKPSYVDLPVLQDSYTNQQSTGSNYATEDALYSGLISGWGRTTFIQFDLTNCPSPEYILRAELRMKVKSYNNWNATTQSLRLINASWNEASITWASSPSTLDLGLGDDISETPPNTLGSIMSWDITRLVQRWKGGDITNYGVSISGQSGSNDHGSWHSSEAANEADRPVLRIYTLGASDGLAYKASASDYLTCRTIVGVATAAATAGNPVTIKVVGIASGSSLTPGAPVFLNTVAGTITQAANNLTRVIRLGRALTSTTWILDIEKQDILINKLASSTAVLGGAQHKIYAPADAKSVLVHLYTGSGSGNNVLFHHRLYREAGAIPQSTIFGPEFDLPANKVWAINWGSNYITIDPANTSAYIQDVIFYT